MVATITMIQGGKGPVALPIMVAQVLRLVLPTVGSRRFHSPYRMVATIMPAYPVVAEAMALREKGGISFLPVGNCPRACQIKILAAVTVLAMKIIFALMAAAIRRRESLSVYR